MKKIIQLMLYVGISATCFGTEEVLENIQKEIFQLKAAVTQSEKKLQEKTSEYNKVSQELKSNEDQLQVIELTLFSHKEKIRKDYQQLKKSWGIMMVQASDPERHPDYLLTRNGLIKNMQQKSALIKNNLAQVSKLETMLAETQKSYQSLRTQTDILLSLIQQLEQDKISLAGKIQSKRNEGRKVEGDFYNRVLEQKVAAGDILADKTYTLPINKYIKYENSQQGVNFFYRNDALVMAPASGKVVYTGELSNYGNVLMIEHDKKMMSVLLGDFVTDVTKDAVVTAGSVIGRLAGERDGGLKSLYYELRREEKVIPTLSYLKI